MVLNNQNKILLIFVLSALLTGTHMYSETACNISPPEITLIELHSGCHGSAKTRYPECVAAMHRYCQKTDYSTNKNHLIGISRENTDKFVSMSCIEAKWAGNVKVTELAGFHSSCKISKSQHRDCLSAIHQYCQNRFGAEYAGISQEVGADEFLIGCFKSGYKENVPNHVMSSLYPGCQFPNSDGPKCFSAASRFCHNYFGLSGGITQEVNNNIMAVACYDGELDQDVFIKRIPDFYEYSKTIRKVCSIEFDMDQAEMLRNDSEILKTEVYSNCESPVELHDHFELSKSVIHKSSFSHDHKLAFTDVTTFDTPIPIATETGIRLSHLQLKSVNLVGENLQTVVYEKDSCVEVPRGHVIIRKAIIIHAKFEVPWKAKIINKLGKSMEIGGTFIGENTLGFKVIQSGGSQDDC